MALVLADRVQESASAPGTGSVTLLGAALGYQSFAVIGNGNTTFYCIADQGGNNWEVGVGTYSSTGPTLARTTVLANSLGTTAKINFSSGTQTVFVTYPSEKSVNLDSSGNVSPLGTIASGVWQGTTVGVAYGGTGVTASSGPNSVVLRDANQNTALNNIDLSVQNIVTTGGTTTFTAATPYFTIFTGTSNQTLVLPDATTLPLGKTFVVDNDSTGTITVKDGSGASFEVIISGGIHNFVLDSNGSVAGTWVRYSLIPSEVEWGTNSLQLYTTVITGGTWNGGTIQPGYGGTGLTTFGAANNAIYSTSSSTATAGTLPVPAGGTGATTLTGYVKGNGTSAMTASSTIPGADISGDISGNAENVNGTVLVTHGGTGLTSVPQYYVPFGNTSTALDTSGNFQYNGSTLRVGNHPPLAGATNPVIAQTGSFNQYIQTYIHNGNSGTSASADFTAYPDNGTDATGWADVGITSSTYADATFSVTGPNESYVFGSAPSGAGVTGNLVYATDSTGSANSHQWYVGGFNQAKSAYKMQLTASYLELKTPLYVTGSAGTSGQILASAGSGAAPTWVNNTAASIDQAYFLSFMMG